MINDRGQHVLTRAERTVPEVATMQLTASMVDMMVEVVIYGLGHVEREHGGRRTSTQAALLARKLMEPVTIRVEGDAVMHRLTARGYKIAIAVWDARRQEIARVGVKAALVGAR